MTDRELEGRLRAWYAAEVEWWSQVWPTLAEDLSGSNRTQIRMALVQIGSRHLDRHRLAQEVARVLQLDDLEVQSLACTTLGQLGSAAAVPALVCALEHDDPVVRMSAWNALRKITRLDLPPDAELWRTSAL